MLIGITGFKLSGKDTVADYLCNNFNYVKYSFASPLKQGIIAFFGWTDQHMNDPILKEKIDPDWGVSPRQILQWMGTDIMREEISQKFPLFNDTVGSNMWINRFRSFVKNSSDKNIVVPDFRFQNEADVLKELGAVLWRIDRISSIPLKVEHKSEDIRDLPYDYIIENNNSLEELFKTIFTTYKGIKI